MARDGETLQTLEGKTVTLDPEMLVIADEDKPAAIAGDLTAFFRDLS